MRSLHSSIAETVIVQSQHSPILVPRKATKPDKIEAETENTMAHITDIRGSAPGLLARLSTLRNDIAARYARHRVYRTTMAELNALSDRDLDDLGISRSMIRGIAREASLDS